MGEDRRVRRETEMCLRILISQEKRPLTSCDDLIGEEELKGLMGGVM